MDDDEHALVATAAKAVGMTVADFFAKPPSMRPTTLTPAPRPSPDVAKPSSSCSLPAGTSVRSATT
ncbi:hypothetical protein ACWF95_37175 [Streptomyces vinaceus]